MNNIFKKVVATTCALGMTLGFCACSQNGDNNTGNSGNSGNSGNTGGKEETISVYYWSAGFGREYMDNIISAFEADNPGLKVDLTATGAVQGGEIWTTPDEVDYDLYFSVLTNYNAGTKYLEPLDELLETSVDGKTLKSRFPSETLALSTSANGKIYSIPYASAVCGLVYNDTIFGEKNYSLPKTTNQFIDLCSDMVSDGLTPFIHYYEYWYYIIYAWMAQYSGGENFNKLWDSVYVDDNGNEKVNSIDLFANNTAKDAANAVIYDLMSAKGNVYVGSNVLSHTDSQTKMLNRGGVMAPNGSWLENEMKGTSYTDTFKMMKTPVISALGTKLGLTESQLVAIVSYVDGDATDAQKEYVKTVDEKIVNRVREARNLYSVESKQYTTVVPKSSQKKDTVKKFLAYYYSDKALEIMENTCRMILPAAYSDGSVRKHADQDTAYIKSCIDITKAGGNRVDKAFKTPLYYNAGISFLYNYSPVREMTYGEDCLTLSQYNEKEKGWWKSNWKSLLNAAGL